jgi:asparagine synthase (glutamine-hydrolysing)
LESPWVSNATSDAALAGLLVFGNIPEPLTAWSDISAVPSGSTITIQRDGSSSVRRFFSVSEEITLAELIPALQSVDELVRDALSDSVNAHMVSDVEVGVFLSAGIDSSAVLGLAAEHRQSLHAVTIGFEEFAGSNLDEVPLARLVAGTYGARHSVDVVTRDDFSSWLPTMLSDMDQPSIDGLNSWLVRPGCRQSRIEGGTVRAWRRRISGWLLDLCHRADLVPPAKSAGVAARTRPVLPTSVDPGAALLQAKGSGNARVW